MKNNRLRQLLNEGKLTLGTHVLSPWPGTVEVIGQTGSDEVQKAHRQVIDTALKKGVAPRVEVGSFEQAEPYIKMGARHFCIGWDTGVLAQWCRGQAEGMKGLLPG